MLLLDVYIHHNATALCTVATMTCAVHTMNTLYSLLYSMTYIFMGARSTLPQFATLHGHVCGCVLQLLYCGNTKLI